MGLKLNAGWSEADITPLERVYLMGQHYARVSEGVMDPVTATVLAFESVKDGVSAGQAVMVSCDLLAVSDELRHRVRGYAAGEKGLEPGNIVLNATHTHSAPHIQPLDPLGVCSAGTESRSREHLYGIELDVMSPVEYMDFAAKKIADAVKQAWKERVPSGVGYGMGQAVIGRNRRLSYENGESVMYGNSSDSGFVHVEGYEDHSVYVMTVYDAKDSLTGLVVNLACPSQVSESSFEISADYWHETREEIRKRFGKNLFVLAQCGPAGDLSPHVLINKRAEERMWRLKGRDVSQNAPRREIAARTADAVGEVLGVAVKEIDRAPGLLFKKMMVDLPRRRITEDDVREAEGQADEYRKKYNELLAGIGKNPDITKEPRWYRPITYQYARMKWFENVGRRFRLQQENPNIPVELAALVVGETAFATSPFELYLDYGVRMRELSPACQTFLIQLAGSGGYLPSLRSVSYGGYGSVPASTDIGPEGGDILVDWTVKTLNELMKGES